MSGLGPQKSPHWPLEANPQDSSTNAAETSTIPDLPLAHHWVMLARFEVSDAQALAMQAGVSPDALPWNLESMRLIGPGCKLCGQEYGESSECPGPGILPGILSIFD